MKIRITLPVKYHRGVYQSDQVRAIVDDLLIWCMERDIDASLYKWDIDREAKEIYAVLTIEKDSAFFIMLSQDARWHKPQKSEIE